MIERLIAVGTLGLVAAGCSDPSATAGSQQAEASDSGWQPPLTEWGEPDLQGTWPMSHLLGIPFERPEATQASRTTSLIIDPPNGRYPELTAKGKELRPLMGSSSYATRFDSVADFDSWDRCISRGMPVSMLPRNYNNGIVIAQSPGYVALKLEMLETRIIPTDGRPPPDPAIKTWMGVPRGHWEGNTLVVESQNFNGLFGGTNSGVPGSPRELNPTTQNLRTLERFTRTADDTIDYQITVEDPEVLTHSVTIAYPLKRDNNYQLYEYACHEDNTAVRNFIETSRHERANAAKEAAAK